MKGIVSSKYKNKLSTQLNIFIWKQSKIAQQRLLHLAELFHISNSCNQEISIKIHSYHKS